MRGILITGFFMLLFLYALPANEKEEGDKGKKYTVNGTISDQSNGEELLGATIYVNELKTGTTTNLYGFYSISLAPGDYTFVYSFIGYAPVNKNITLNAHKTINIELKSKEEILEEVIITAERKDENVTRTEMSSIRMDSKTVEKIPALMGEVDVLKALQLLPGVQSISEGSSGYSVRGGSAGQNLIQLDEATVYNASHLLGFFSVFNNDAIKDVKLYKGDIPAWSGGRLSSLLDIRMKEGNNKKLSGTGGIGTISSRLTFEGPLASEKTSFLLSGRRTYLDLFLPFASNEEVRENKLYFFDFNTKFNHRIDKNNRIFVSGYFGRDVFKNDYFNMSLGNSTFTTRWNHLFSEKLFSNFTFIYSKYDYNLGTPSGEANSFLWKSNLEDFSFKADFNLFANPQNTLKFGVASTYHTFEPGSAKGIGEKSMFNEYKIPENHALEHAIYVSNEHKVIPILTLKYGLRYSIFQNIGKGTIYNFDDNYNAIDSTVYNAGDIFNTYAGLEPRLGLNFMINEVSSIKASYALTRQYIHLAQNSTAGSPLDIWFPSTPNVEPQLANQYAVGYFRNFNENTMEASVELYYKTMNHSIDFKDHAQLLLNRELEGELRFGEAWSYGAEFLFKVSEGRLNGWLGYTYSKTHRKFEDINTGKKYPAPYDKPHDISIVVNFKINNRNTVSANWVYSSGQPVTFPTGRAEIGNTIIPIYSDRNAYRMEDYHRLDLSYTLKGKKKPGRSWQGEWNFSVYNAYGRKNPWTINFRQENDNPNITYAEKTYLFSFVPAITYDFKF